MKNISAKNPVVMNLELRYIPMAHTKTQAVSVMYTFYRCS